MTKQEFIQTIAGYVKEYAADYGIKVHSPIIAQAIHESRWGESLLAAAYHNYFGLKCGTKWKGASVNLSTQEEYSPGTLTTIQDNFRVYGNMEEGIRGYFEFLQLPRYQNLKGITDPRTYLETIKADNFATESDYMENNMKLIEQYNLTRYDGKDSADALTPRSRLVSLAQSWIGKNEADGSHREIIDLYNGHTPLARGYKVKYTDSWCATFASAVAIAAGYTDIIPTECGCGQMIQLFQAMGRWVEDDAYVPAPGDYIFYDWDDSGVGDNTGWPDHVGIVDSVADSIIMVIEGNKSDAVDYRHLQVNGKYIRGYGVPDYESKAFETGSSDGKIESETGKPGTLCKQPQWIGRVTGDGVNVRRWAGTENENIKSWPKLSKNSLVDVCDQIKAADDSSWYYIRIDGHIYGFAYSDYIDQAVFVSLL